MKTRNLLLILTVALFFSGCVIWSFYPLYTEKDLFANDILTGNWTDSDGLQWNFRHPVTKTQTDSTSYELYLIDSDSSHTGYVVNIVKLQGNYFLDFYLFWLEVPGAASTTDRNYPFWYFQILHVHTFAKLTIANDKLQIDWFDGKWLQNQIEAKKIKIRHEDNGESLLLTAKTADLQKLVVKYVNSEEAFEEGMKVILTRK